MKVGRKSGDGWWVIGGVIFSFFGIHIHMYVCILMHRWPFLYSIAFYLGQE